MWRERRADHDRKSLFHGILQGMLWWTARYKLKTEVFISRYWEGCWLKGCNCQASWLKRCFIHIQTTSYSSWTSKEWSKSVSELPPPTLEHLQWVTRAAELGICLRPSRSPLLLNTFLSLACFLSLPLINGSLEKSSSWIPAMLTAIVVSLQNGPKPVVRTNIGMHKTTLLYFNSRGFKLATKENWDWGLGLNPKT